ncbi:hypothetical protein BM221_001072 [Beauveria bassiana]|uniref:Uncharacterized protein n=1 Tax=Beauveria bassiana TaxID=176275 RepID=A0A2N6P2A0_BEABA|nr:hypothetical protein BM221_001072 [Beauveria bassiana]
MSEPAQQTTTLPLHTTRESGDRRGTQQEKKRASSSAASSAQQKTTTTSWTPNFERRQSWNAQDRKHELQMAALDSVRTGPGFTERSP